MSAAKSLTSRPNLMFGRYRLRVRERVLENEGKPVAIPEKTLDVLCILLEHAGELVEKETLKQKVWPGIFVEDTNIAFQISTLRRLLQESANEPRFIATVPKRGYRFIAAVSEETEPEQPKIAAPGETDHPPFAEAIETRRASSRRIWIGAAILVALFVALVFYSNGRPRAVTALSERGTIVLANIENKTGDPVFDETLRQGLLVELEQSPFLHLLSEERLRQTMRLMRQPEGASLTHEVAMGVCQRTGSTVLMEGSIERVGGLYVLALRALNCNGGELVDAEQAKAGNREHVLDALSSMAARFRARVGETAATLQLHNRPLAEATTASVEALRAYTTGWSVHTTRGASEAIPIMSQAVRLDPEFAMAYAALGRMYADIDESDLSAENLQKAWDLKDRTSDRERFFIAANYLCLVTGNLDEARKAAEAWARMYPRDAAPHTLLSGLPNKAMGRYEEAASQARRAIQLDPGFGISYCNLAVNSSYLRRLDAAASTLADTTKLGLDIEEFRMLAYDLAFLRQDTEGIGQIVSQTRQRPNAVSWLVNREAFRAAYSGHLAQARSISGQAVAEAERLHERERAGVWEAGEALRKAMTGNGVAAKKSAVRALLLSKDREVEYGAGLALAIAGDSQRAQSAAENLEERWPEDTTVRVTYVPVIRAQLALNRGKPTEAVEVLKQATPMELGVSRSPANTLFGAHSGLVVTDQTGALALLQLGRAYVISGENGRAKSAYESFLALWKDADRDIPIFRQAQAEYAKLRYRRTPGNQ